MAVRSFNSFSSGKHYFEITIGATYTGGDTGPGICTSAANINTVGVNATQGFIVYPSGNIYYNGSVQGIATGAIATNDVLQFAVDLTNKRIWVRINRGGTLFNWNGTVGADPATNTSGFDISSLFTSNAAYPFQAFGPSASGSTSTANFGGSAFASSPPSGFTDWCGPAPTTYHAPAVHLDGSTWLTNSSLITPSSSLFSAVFWFKTNNSAIEATLYVVDPNNYVVPYFDIHNGTLDIELGSFPNAGNDEYITSTSTSYIDNQWHSVILTIDASTSAPKKVKIYIDNVDVMGSLSSSNSTGGSYQVLGNGYLAQIGYDNTGSGGFFIGDISDFRVFYGVCLLDGTGNIPLATRQLFVNASGKPVDPAVATAALGTATILLSGNASTFATNQGAGGAFAITGALSNATTSPSD